MPSTSRTTATAMLAVLMFLVPGPASASGSGTDTGVWPLLPRPEVVAGFDPPAENWDAGHRGVDLLGTSGQTVRAAKSGRISYAGRLAGRGIVVVTHGYTRTTYQPVAATVHVGDDVIAGQQIGVLQPFGSHCWPRTCLHWGLIRGETYLDPLTLVGAGPVRLLPFYRGLGLLVGALAVGQYLTQSAAQSVTQPGSLHGLRLATPGGVLAGRPPAVGLW